MSQNTDFVPFALPSLGAEEEAAVLEVLRSGWLTTGKVARAFEAEFAAFVTPSVARGDRQLRALAVNSATSGLHLALEALGVGPGDLVVTSPYTFTSSAAVVRHLGAELRFCDVTEEGYDLDPARLEEILRAEPRVKAVVPVHVGGLPCRMREILDLCRARGVRVVEDAAHSFPSRLPEGMAGTLGDAGVYSFYATKTITTGEGGMIVTADEDLAARMAKMRLHGFDREAWDRYTSKKASWYYEVVEAGFKYNLPDLLAAIGREQLKKADRFLEERRAIARTYDEAFGGHPALELPPRGDPERAASHAWHLYALRLSREFAGREERDAFIQALQDRGIGVSVHFIPLHLMPYYAQRYGLKPQDFPRALDRFERSLSLPIWQGLGVERADRVARTVLELADSLSRRGR